MKNKLFLSLMMAFVSAVSAFGAYDFQTGGVYYSKLSDNTCAVSYFYSGGYSGAVNIPETVEYDETYTVVAIAADAFKNCSRLTSVTLPATLTSIGDNAFNYCTGLTSIEIPAAVEKIGAGAFSGCRGIKEFNLPEGLKSIGNNAFNSCSTITTITIPEGVTSIDESTFYGCTALTSVTMSDNVTKIDRYAFNYCSKLTTFNFPTALETVGQYAFNSCKGLTAITIPATTTEIGSYAFFNCSAATDLRIEDSDASLTVGADAFAGVGCNNVYIGRNIEGAVLSGNGSVKTLEIGGNCTTIPAESFKNCTSLEEMTLGSSVNTIGTDAFTGCAAITKINSENPEPPVASSPFEDDVYANCELAVPGGAKSAYQTAEVWKDFTNITDPTETGITELTIDNDAVYYTLQGVRVNGTLTPGIYICRNGQKTVKVLVK